MAAVTARLLGAGTALTDHGLLGRTWGGLAHGLFDRFLAVSQFSARVLGAPAARTQVIYGGADTQRFTPAPGTDRDGVLFVGRLTPHKGIDRLLEALPAGASLRIAGSAGHDLWPPERDYPALLRQLAQGRDVEFLGPVLDAARPPVPPRRGPGLPSFEDLLRPRRPRLGAARWRAGAMAIGTRCGQPDRRPGRGRGSTVRPASSSPRATPGARDCLARLVADRRLAAPLGATPATWSCSGSPGGPAPTMPGRLRDGGLGGRGRAHGGGEGVDQPGRRSPRARPGDGPPVYSTQRAPTARAAAGRRGVSHQQRRPTPRPRARPDVPPGARPCPHPRHAQAVDPEKNRPIPSRSTSATRSWWRHIDSNDWLSPAASSPPAPPRVGHQLQPLTQDGSCGGRPRPASATRPARSDGPPPARRTARPAG